jgi:hypothetical protein
MKDENQRKIPGTFITECREYRYISDDGHDKFFRNGLFKKLTSQINPPIPKNGGTITENCKLWLPSGELLHALSYRGDIDGWREQIEQGAAQLGLFAGKIAGDKITLSDGRYYELSDCKVEFY